MSVLILFFILFINIYAFTNIVSVMQGKENNTYNHFVFFAVITHHNINPLSKIQSYNVRRANVIAQVLHIWRWRLRWCANKNFNLGHNFQTRRNGLSYCTCVFLVTRPFTWYHNFFYLVTLTLKFDLLLKLLTLAITIKLQEIGLS